MPPVQGVNRYAASIEDCARNTRGSLKRALSPPQKFLQENTMENTGLSLGIDIGGTFTDLVLLDPRDGKTTIWKEPTTADDPSRGAMLGLTQLVFGILGPAVENAAGRYATAL